MKKLISFVLFISMLLFCLTPFAAFAAEPLNPEKHGSISITLAYPDTKLPISGVRMDLFRVGDVFESNGRLRYVLAQGYTDSGITLECDESGNFDPNTAISLNNFVIRKGISGIPSVTDANGKSYIGNCKPGLYLIVVGSLPKPSDYGDVDPFLVSVPSAVANSNEYEYSVTAKPKVPMEVGNSTFHDPPSTTNPTTTTNTPDVTTPDKTDPNYVNGDGDSENNNSDKNTAGSNDSEDNSDSTNNSSGNGLNNDEPPKKLPYTGVLKWPIPVLAFAGPVLFAFGYFDLTRRTRKNED